jgi:hypothetical protein
VNRRSADAGSRTALAISALIPVVVGGGTAIGFLSHADWMLPVVIASVVLLLWCASPYVREFEKEHGALRSNVVGAARRYVEFHADRAGIPPRSALLVVWGLWTIPALGWGALAVASIGGLTRA